MPDHRTSFDRERERRERAQDEKRGEDERRLHRTFAFFLFATSPEMNAGSFDRATRIALGAFLFVLVFVGPHTRWGLLGILPLVTGCSGVCPLYRAFGISTLQRPAPEEDADE